MFHIRAIKDIVRSNRRRKSHETASQNLDRRVAEFVAKIDSRVEAFELDPETPEIQELKADAREIIAQPMGEASARLLLGWLNPYDSVVYNGSHLTIFERDFGHVLKPWTLMEFHLRSYTMREIVRIRVDGSGTHVYAYSPNREVAVYCAGVLNPHRLADPGNRVQNAAVAVNHLTGLELDWRELHKFHWLEITKQTDGSWVVQYDPEAAYIGPLYVGD